MFVYIYIYIENDFKTFLYLTKKKKNMQGACNASQHSKI